MTEPIAKEQEPSTVARLERRRLLRTSANPNQKIDYLATLTREASAGGPRVVLSYVPGKLLLAPAAFESYLAAALAAVQEPLEALTLEILDDVNNELVPRWVQVRVEGTGVDNPAHVVIVEDRQPKWDNPALLSRLD